WATDGDLLGVARWMPPGKPDVNVGAMLRALIATPLRVREATNRFFAYGRAVEALRARAVPEPHWYLAGIGVDPPFQRRGVGGALLGPGLAAPPAAGAAPPPPAAPERDLPPSPHPRVRGGLAGRTPRVGPPPRGGGRAWRQSESR